MLRPNAFSHWLDRRIERLPKGWFLLVRDVKGAAWSAFEDTVVFEYLDRREHEYNMLAMARRWVDRPHEGPEFKDELVHETIRTQHGKKKLALSIFSAKKQDGRL